VLFPQALVFMVRGQGGPMRRSVAAANTVHSVSYGVYRTLRPYAGRVKRAIQARRSAGR
jgi:hypothetical protein